MRLYFAVILDFSYIPVWIALNSFRYVTYRYETQQWKIRKENKTVKEMEDERYKFAK